jgi:bla regulator protein BlaR1
MIPEYLFALGNHLWQSTVFTAAAGLLALALRKNHAKVRHGLWLAASLKFLLPFALLVGMAGHLGRQLGWAPAPAIARAGLANPSLTMAMNEIGQPFSSAAGHGAAPATHPIAPLVLPAIWLWGCVGVVSFWCIRSRRVREAARGSVPLNEGREMESLRRLRGIAGIRPGIELRASHAALEPGVFGVFHPVLLLPEGIADRLTDAELDAIIGHEVFHVCRRDNLTSAMHMVVDAVFWFHPLVWWLGARLVEERERACDEEVLRLGSEPAVYAEGILKVCKFYLESPVVCVAGVTGSNIKKRIEDIMTAAFRTSSTLRGRPCWPARESPLWPAPSLSGC